MANKKVLLLDQNDDVRQWLRVSLLVSGLAQEVVEAIDEKSALELCLGLRPDVVFLDDGAPRAAAAASVVRDVNPAAKIIALSSGDERAEWADSQLRRGVLPRADDLGLD